MNALLSDSRRDAAYGEVQAAYAAVLTAHGQDAAELGQAAIMPVADLAAWLRQAERSAFAVMPRPATGPERLAATGNGGR